MTVLFLVGHRSEEMGVSAAAAAAAAMAATAVALAARGAGSVGGELWSKGPRAAGGCAYARAATESVCDEAELRRYVARCAGGTLWVRLGSGARTRTDLDVVAESLGALSAPVVLVTGDGDRAVPSSYADATVRALLASPMVERWLTQNYDGTVAHPKLRPVPIGLDLHTPRWAGDTPGRKADRKSVV